MVSYEDIGRMPVDVFLTLHADGNEQDGADKPRPAFSGIVAPKVGAADEAAEDAPLPAVEAAVELEELPPQAARPMAAAPAPTILIKLRREMRFIVLSSNNV